VDVGTSSLLNSALGMTGLIPKCCETGVLGSKSREMILGAVLGLTLRLGCLKYSVVCGA
jgi:hypothetical protein